MIRTILLIPLMMSLLACGLFTQDEGESGPACGYGFQTSISLRR